MGNYETIRRKAAAICPVQGLWLFSEIYFLLTAAFAFEVLFLCGRPELYARQKLSLRA